MQVRNPRAHSWKVYSCCGKARAHAVTNRLDDQVSERVWKFLRSTSTCHPASAWTVLRTVWHRRTQVIFCWQQTHFPGFLLQKYVKRKNVGRNYIDIIDNLHTPFASKVWALRVLSTRQKSWAKDCEKQNVSKLSFISWPFPKHPSNFIEHGRLSSSSLTEFCSALLTLPTSSLNFLLPTAPAMFSKVAGRKHSWLALQTLALFL